jgi:hypothetical protein
MTPPTLAALGHFRLAAPLQNPSAQALAACFRGAVASLFAADTAFHGHAGDAVKPRYPEVHYRWVDGAPALFALGPAAQRALAHPWPNTVLRLGEEDARVLQVAWTTSAITHEISRRLVRYDFGAPWVALNQDNYARYKSQPRAARREELDRILVGNLLTMSQAFGWYYEPGETVYAAFEPAGEVSATVKGTPLIGFRGTFVTNLALPDGLAVGRSVSHGFGWFQRAD